MTEAEWLACTDPWTMAVFLKRRGSGRKLILYGAACCRRAWHLSDDPRHHDAVEAAERFANGELGEARFEEALAPVVDLWARSEEFEWGPFRYMTAATRHLSRQGGEYAASFAVKGLAGLRGEPDSPAWLGAVRAEHAIQCALLRDIFGNPSRPLHLDPAWLSGDGAPAVELAREIESEKRFDDLPRLAEALERAGCRDRAVIDHCLAPGPHVLGCWALDLLLGREDAVQSGLTTEANWLDLEDPTTLLHFLGDKGTDRDWRRFAVACCRRIDRFIVDERSRRAVNVAERHAEGLATDGELEEVRAAAQAAEKEAKSAEWTAEAGENFCLTPRHAAISRELFAARAARSATCRDPRLTDEPPDSYEASRWSPSHAWADAVVRWDVYATIGDPDAVPESVSEENLLGSFKMTEHGKMISGPPAASVEEAAEGARKAELRVQAQILRDLFGDFLGPPGSEGEWMPGGPPSPTPEWWCLRPEPRTVDLGPGWRGWSDGLIPRLAREIHDAGAYDRLDELADALEQAGCTDPAILDHLQGGPHWRGCWALELLMGGGSRRLRPWTAPTRP